MNVQRFKNNDSVHINCVDLLIRNVHSTALSMSSCHKSALLITFLMLHVA